MQWILSTNLNVRLVPGPLCDCAAALCGGRSWQGQALLKADTPSVIQDTHRDGFETNKEWDKICLGEDPTNMKCIVNAPCLESPIRRIFGASNVQRHEGSGLYSKRHVVALAAEGSGLGFISLQRTVNGQ